MAELGRTKKVNLPISQLLRLEQVLLASIKYHLMVFHPYRFLSNNLPPPSNLQTFRLDENIRKHVVGGGMKKEKAPLLFLALVNSMKPT